MDEEFRVIGRREWVFEAVEPRRMIDIIREVQGKSMRRGYALAVEADRKGEVWVVRVQERPAVTHAFDAMGYVNYTIYEPITLEEVVEIVGCEWVSAFSG